MLETQKVEAGTGQLFKQAELDSCNSGKFISISPLKLCTQAENETRSANIKWGIIQYL